MTVATVFVPPWVAVLVLVGVPLAAWIAFVTWLDNRELTDDDRYCGLVDQELDAGLVDREVDVVGEVYRASWAASKSRSEGLSRTHAAIRALPEESPCGQIRRHVR